MNSLPALSYILVFCKWAGSCLLGQVSGGGWYRTSEQGSGETIPDRLPGDLERSKDADGALDVILDVALEE